MSDEEKPLAPGYDLVAYQKKKGKNIGVCAFCGKTVDFTGWKTNAYICDYATASHIPINGPNPPSTPPKSPA